MKGSWMSSGCMVQFESWVYEPQTGDQNPCTVHSKTGDTGSFLACVVRRATLSVFITSGSDSKQHAMKVGVRLSYSSSFMCMRVPEWKDHMTLKKKERSLLTPALHKDPAFLTHSRRGERGVFMFLICKKLYASWNTSQRLQVLSWRQQRIRKAVTYNEERMVIGGLKHTKTHWASKEFSFQRPYTFPGPTGLLLRTLSLKGYQQSSVEGVCLSFLCYTPLTRLAVTSLKSHWVVVCGQEVAGVLYINLQQPWPRPVNDS